MKNNQIRLAGLFLVGMLLIFGLQISPAQAATLTASDEASLAAAINSANANADFDIIELTADINLATTTTYSFNGATGLPIITKPLAIRGNGHTIRRTSSTQFRLLGVNNTQVWLEDISLAGGDVVGSGGALYSTGTNSILNLLRVTVGGSLADRNKATTGGGGIVAYTLTMIDSEVSYNLAEGSDNFMSGGGVAIGGFSHIVGSQINYNQLINSNPSPSQPSKGGGVSAGALVLINSSVNYNEVSGSALLGVGVYTTSATSIINSEFVGNHNLGSPTSVFGSGVKGGGLYNDYSNAYPEYQYVHIIGSRFINNSLSGAYVLGAGVYVAQSVTIDSSTFEGNVLTSPVGSSGRIYGGGLVGSSAQISNSSFLNNRVNVNNNGNSGDKGAAAFYFPTYGTGTGNSNVVNTSISGNVTQFLNQTVYPLGAAHIYNANLNNVTITNNSIENLGAYFVMGGLTFTGSSNTVSNSIISGNYKTYTNVNGSFRAAANCWGSSGSSGEDLESLGYNAIESDYGCQSFFQQPTDIIGTVSLSPLANNGGLSFTHAISAIPPVDRGNPATSGNGVCAATDQRGAPRVGRCDIGAYEANGIVPAANQAPIAGNDVYGTSSNASIVGLVGLNDSDPENQTLRYYLNGSANHGSVQFSDNGGFIYTAITDYSGNDSFTYRVCDNWGLCTTATVSIQINDTSGLPDAPILSMDSVESFAVNLSWIDNSGDATGFAIERRANGAAWQRVATVDEGGLSYTDSGLLCLYPYDYRVRAYQETTGSYSMPSNVVSVTTTNCPPPPNLRTTTINYERIELAWGDNLSDETSFTLERSLDNGASWQALSHPGANVTWYSHTNLTCGTSYQYRIRSNRTSPAMTSDYSPALSVSTTACPPLPLAPTDLAGSPVDYTMIELSWTDNATDEDSYHVYASSNGFSTWNEYYVGNYSGSVSIAGLSCSTSYEIRVNAKRYNPIIQFSDYSNTISVTTNNCPPLPNSPSNLTVTETAYSNLTIGWTDNAPDETNYRVERSTNGGTSWTQIANNIAANTTSYTNTSLSCNTSYMYRVRAYRSTPVQQYSEYSNVVTGKTTACVAPTAPSGLSLSGATSSTINLSWTDNSNSESYFEIFRSINGTSWTSIDTEDSNDTAYTATSLTCNTLYYFRVRAVNPSGSSGYSNVASTTTLGCPPATPTNFARTMTGTTSINLSWADNATNETAYYLERSSDSGSTWTVLDALPANSISFANTGLSCGTSYRYRLRAYRSSDGMYSSYATTSDASTSSCPARPATPTNVVISTVGATALKLNWTDAATTETNYRIERSDDNWNTSTIVGELGANSNTFTDNTILCDGNYSYRVYAYILPENVLSYAGNSSTLRIPCAPSNLVMDFSSNWSVGLDWDDSSSWSTKFHIEASSDGGLSWQEIAVIDDNGSNYAAGGMDCGTSRQYRVRAFATIGGTYSAYSNIITASTNPCTITEASCTLEQLDLSSHNGNTLGPVWLSGNGKRIAINYQASSVVTTGMYLYDIPSETIVANFPNAVFGDINVDGSRLTFISSANPLGTNADGNDELFYWNNGVLSQLTNTSIDSAFGQAQISDDGSLVVFAGDGDVVGDPSQGAFLLAWDAVNGLRKLIPEAGVGDLALSGDGSTIAFEHDLSLSGQGGFTRHLYRWSAADGVQLLFQLSYPESYNGTLLSLHINGDGSRILFSDNNDPLGTNPDKKDDVFLWDETRGLRQLTEADDYFGFLGSIDGSGNRVVFWTGEELDTDSTASGSIGYYFYDEGYGYSQITSVPIGDHVTFGQSLSSDGLTAAMLASVGWNGTGDVYPYVEVFVADCTPANHLPVPGSLTAVAEGEDGINLTWADNSLSENEYRIERSADGTNWIEIAELAANSTSYSDNSLQCETEYQYRVRGYRAWDEHYSDYSNIANESSSLACANAPTGLIVTGTSQTSVSLSWADNADETSYSLERSSDGVNWVVIQALAANTTSFTDITTVCNTRYDYRLRAYRSSDSQYSAYSNVAAGMTSACPAPNAPTGLTVSSVGYTNINLRWIDNASDETSYSLERSADAGASWMQIAQPAANATSYSDTSATCNTSYDYRLRAYRSGDSQFSDYSNTVTGTTDICIVLNAPTNIQQTANSQSGMSLSWTDNSTNESGYEIERSLDGTNWTLLSSLPANSTSYSDSGLTCSTGYQYRLRSNHLGTATYSPYGSSAVLATASCPALVPSVLSSTGATQNSISLSWTVDSNGTSFTLAYYNGTSWVNLGIFPSTTTSYTHTGLSCNRSYQYQVTTFRVTDSASVSSGAFSTSTSACPPLANPNAPIVVNTEPALVSLQIPAMPATATSMSLERSTDGLSWTNLGNVSTNYIDTAVVCGGTYQYRLVAVRSGDGVTSNSTTAIAVTDACPIPNVVGVYRAGLWVFVDSNNTATPSNSFNFGDNSWQALVGDWDGDGIDGVGIYRNGEFVLKNLASADSPENRFNFGNAEAGWQALVGDWNGDGIDSVGLYKDGLFILSDDNSNMNYRFNFGYLQAGWQVLAGDWDGNGADGIALYKEGLWMLANDVNNPDASSFSLSYGPNQAGWTAIVGDWNGDGQDSIGLYGNGIWRMRTNSVNDATETSLNFGQTGDIPLAIFEN